MFSIICPKVFLTHPITFAAPLVLGIGFNFKSCISLRVKVKAKKIPKRRFFPAESYEERGLAPNQHRREEERKKREEEKGGRV